ncbi:unnamed protein product [Rotaria sp. Silwood2]|nr:unnamed protein product [Rotaria sp. Silwood2]
MTDINNNAHDLIKSTTIVSKSKHLSILEWFWRLGKQWWQLEIQETEHVDALDQLNICDPFTRLNSDDLLDQKRLTDITSATTTVSSELPFSSTLETLSILPDESLLASQGNINSSEEENFYPISTSFSGKNRDKVEQICEEVQKELSEKIFFAPWYQHEVAQIYGNRFLRKVYEKASLVVVFLSRDYAMSNFCFYEWRVIQQRFMVRPAEQKNHRLLLIKLDDIDEEALDLFKDDFYIDVLETTTAKDMADLIIKRWRIVEQLPST